MSERVHIGVFGKCNAGKSTLINAILNQDLIITSPIPGTTTDPVYKSIELYGLGPCLLADTAGFDELGHLGAKRLKKSKIVAAKTDIAIIIFSGKNIDHEIEWLNLFQKNEVDVYPVINSFGDFNGDASLADAIRKSAGREPIILNAFAREGVDDFISMLAADYADKMERRSITGKLAAEGDLVLLIMPQDIQAPQGRLILPQVQVLRDLLDKKAVVVSATTDKMEDALKVLSSAPKLIITDSQAFKKVYDLKPAESMLTSFSVLMAGYKGDINEYISGADALEHLNGNSNILIAEACSHKPLNEDIGRIQIPRMLRNKFGNKIQIKVCAGNDFPDDLSLFDLIIQCGGCMFNRKNMLSRIKRARACGVPITNYGIVIAKMTGILEKISFNTIKE
ncbi:MAG: [FeFe] hydrogenase H-cluster maturation GTPase HydF [Deferribacteraceae bacterium]|jgi:[FeFe] hydrogenase H-cluster maturation GTPase HydF|nr:[FeFe] hydrogenase H-cluster maturation GTPase HydF [Deferribacteraceae bacterium]